MRQSGNQNWRLTRQKRWRPLNPHFQAIDQALQHPGLETATGLQGRIDPRNYIPGTDSYNFNVRLDQLKGKTFLQAFEQLKGGGKLRKSKAKRRRTQSPG